MERQVEGSLTEIEMASNEEKVNWSNSNLDPGVQGKRHCRRYRKSDDSGEGRIQEKQDQSILLECGRRKAVFQSKQ